MKSFWTPRFRRGVILGLVLLVAWVSGRHLADVAVCAAVSRLRRGVGDTTFLSADGEPSFRLDEQRHDVALAEMAAHLQRAVVAVEDRPVLPRAGIAESAWSGRSYAIFEPERARAHPAAGAHALSVQQPNFSAEGEGSVDCAAHGIRAVEPQSSSCTEPCHLSAGVYGVQTMAGYLFRKPASASRCRKRPLIAGLIPAPSTLSPWSNSEGALQRIISCSRACSATNSHVRAGGRGAKGPTRQFGPYGRRGRRERLG